MNLKTLQIILIYTMFLAVGPVHAQTCFDDQFDGTELDLSKWTEVVLTALATREVQGGQLLLNENGPLTSCQL